MELVAHRQRPPIREVWRAEDSDAGDLVAVKQLAGDEQGLNGLADADVVRDEQPHDVLTEREEERDELVRPRLDAEPREAPEGAGT